MLRGDEMTKQAEVVFYILEHYPVDNKELYEKFKNLYSDNVASNNKMIRKAKDRFDQKLKITSIDEIKKYYEKRYGNNSSNNKSNNESNNSSNNESNNSKKPIKPAPSLTKAEIIKLKKMLAEHTESNNLSNNIPGARKKHTINLNVDLVEQLKKEADKQNISLSEILNQLIDRFING